jgi:hypothetical protein
LDELKAAIKEFADELEAETGGRPVGMQVIPEETQAFRAETLEEFISAGVEIGKIDRLRSYLQSRAGHTLVPSDKLMQNYIAPISKKDTNKTRAEQKGQLVGVYHDGTTHEGEAFAIINRWADEDLNTRLRALVVRFLDGSVDNKQIASLILQAESESGHVALSDILAIMNDSVSANLTAFESNGLHTTHFRLKPNSRKPNRH